MCNHIWQPGMGRQATKTGILHLNVPPPFDDLLQALPRLDPTSLAKQYVSLCTTPAVNSSSPQLSKHHVLDLYGEGLAAAAELQKKSEKPETLRARPSAFTEWMQSKHAACNRKVEQATPDDIMVYRTQHRLPHVGLVTADGELIAAPRTSCHVFTERRLRKSA